MRNLYFRLNKVNELLSRILRYDVYSCFSPILLRITRMFEIPFDAGLKTPFDSGEVVGRYINNIHKFGLSFKSLKISVGFFMRSVYEVNIYRTVVSVHVFNLDTVWYWISTAQVLGKF